MDEISKETYEDRGNLANNCGQIFAKGPKITKDIVSKVRKSDLGNNRNFICGYEFKTRHIWVLSGLFILFVTSLFTTNLLWFTNYFDTTSLQNLKLHNGTDAFTNFMKPKAKPYVGVHIFNYTNVDDFERGIAKKLHVQDVGPYVFQEIIERVNPVFGDDGSLTFQEKRSYKFMPEMSNGLRQSDQLVVPNLPLLGSVAMVKDTYFMTRLSLATVLRGLNAKPFLTLAAHRFIWGYDDSFFSLVKSVMAFQKEMPFEKFGLLAPKNGTSKDRITINTGEYDLNELGKIMRFNGDDKMGHWSTDECNRIDGTMGVFFSPYEIRNKEPVGLYTKDLCRKLGLYFQKEVKLIDGKYTAYRYTTGKHAFAHPDIEPSNQCFCDMETGVCPPSGIFNATPCSYGPTYLSYPHFLHGDPKLIEEVTGLHPDENIHSTYLDVHPTFGYTMAGYTKMQLNMQVRKAYGIPQVDMFKDETMLPVAWFDAGLSGEQLPKHIHDIFELTSNTLPIIENSLKYGSALMAILTFISMVMIIQGRLRSKRPIRTIPPFQRNISGLSSLIN